VTTVFLDRFVNLLARNGEKLTPSAAILDFGCGAGSAVYALVDRGFTNTYGFDAFDHLKHRSAEERQRFCFGMTNGSLPFSSDTFDFVFSEEVFEHVHNQVPVWREIYRIMKPGGVAIHAFPGPYCLIEPHNHVPFGGVIIQYWWFKLWALFGIRNEFQREANLNSTKTARWNTFRAVENLNYISNSAYKVIWEDIGFEWKWLTQDTLDLNSRAIIRLIGRLNRVLPIFGWVLRTFFSRKVLLRKPSSS
jgi:SAM-dependent methyltransferase